MHKTPAQIAAQLRAIADAIEAEEVHACVNVAPLFTEPHSIDITCREDWLQDAREVMEYGQAKVSELRIQLTEVKCFEPRVVRAESK